MNPMGIEVRARNIVAVSALLATSIGGAACQPHEVMAARQICETRPDTEICLGEMAAIDTSVVQVPEATPQQPNVTNQFTPKQIEFMRAVQAGIERDFMRVMQINTTMGPSDASLARLRACEGSYTSVSPTGKYRGAYQFDQRTWNGVMGGSAGLPRYVGASPEQTPAGVQDAAARILYKARRAQPWPKCGKNI